MYYKRLTKPGYANNVETMVKDNVPMYSLSSQPHLMKEAVFLVLPSKYDQSMNTKQ